MIHYPFPCDWQPPLKHASWRHHQIMRRWISSQSDYILIHVPNERSLSTVSVNFYTHKFSCSNMNTTVIIIVVIMAGTHRRRVRKLCRREIRSPFCVQACACSGFWMGKSLIISIDTLYVISGGVLVSSLLCKGFGVQMRLLSIGSSRRFIKFQPLLSLMSTLV